MADAYIAHYGLQQRIRTMVADLWHDPFPPADVHFYSNIYHDWPPGSVSGSPRRASRAYRLGAASSFTRCCITTSKRVRSQWLAWHLSDALEYRGQQFSGHELATMLAEVGFRDIEVRPTFGYWSIVTGRKV